MTEKLKTKKKLSRAEAARQEACVLCGYSANAHRLANFADGPLIGANVLICPTATYKTLADMLAKKE